MKNIKRNITAVITVLIVAFIIWQMATGWALLSGKAYPGFINEADLGLPAEIQAQLEVQLNTALAVLEGDGEDIGQMQSVAVLQKSLGQYAEARRNIEEVVERNQINVAAWTIYGDIALDMEDYETAELAYARALELQVSDQLVYKLEQLWREHLPEQQAQIGEFYESIIAQRGQRPFYLIQLARWYEEEDRLQEAADHMKVASDLEPDNVELREEYEKLKDKARNSN